MPRRVPSPREFHQWVSWARKSIPRVHAESAREGEIRALLDQVLRILLVHQVIVFPASPFFDVASVYAADDARWFRSLGLNLQRLAINYRHLNDDMDPYVIKEEGFKWIDRVVRLVSVLLDSAQDEPDVTVKNAAEGIFTILDLHAAPGGQNFDWHSDNAMPAALLWEYREFQDRTVKIWEAIATHYRG